MLELIETIKLKADASDLASSSLSPDRSTWAFHRGDELWHFDATGAPRAKVPGKRARCVFGVDGSWWAAGRAVERFSSGSSKPTMSVPTPAGDRRLPVIDVSPSGTWLLVAGEELLTLWDVRGAEPVKVFQYPYFMPIGALLDDRRAVVRSMRGAIRFELKRGPKVTAVPNPSVRSWCLDPSGKGMIASVSAGFVWRIPFTGTSRPTLATGDLGAVAASVDGRWVAAAERTPGGERARLIDTKRRAATPLYGEVDRGALGLAFDRSGSRLYAAHVWKGSSVLRSYAIE